uniref:Chloride channel protein n=1 Tax=Macrostomum lignano TaxID=282301 RepID=A0A1I8IAU5_9PLAT
MLLLLHFALLKLVSAAVSLTLAIPTGVFMPTFVAGAAIGRLYGELSGHDHPVWFVLAGAAAFSGAATGTLSTSLIVFELSVLIANFAMHACGTLPFYDLGIRIKRLPHAPITSPILLARCSKIKVSQVMLPPERAVKIGLGDTNDALRKLLRRHPNFESLPLVQYDEAHAEPGNADDRVCSAVLELM